MFGTEWSACGRKKMKGINLRRLIISMFFSFMIVAIFPAHALAEEEYVFDRMWPVLEPAVVF